MLILTRKIGSSIVIGQNIVLTVVDVKGDKVKLGIEAPGSVRVDRSEIRERKDGGLTRRNGKVKDPIEQLYEEHGGSHG